MLTTWFEQFLTRISRLLPSDEAEAELRNLAQIDPQRISVENVRNMLNSSATAAKLYCETAVRRGLLRRGYQYWCPDGKSVAATVFEGEILPSTVDCIQEEEDDYRVLTLETAHLRKTEIFAIR